ncbi:MAG: BREX system P-loop protein BrxC, partial [Dorea sp.]|nr:BREX system P-loop protein BrxC [Dorea sp.]
KTISATMMRDVKEMLREYFDIMDVPDDEDGLIRFVTEKFSEQRDYYTSLNGRYEGHKYPDRGLVQAAISLMDDVLSQKKDNIALIERVLKKEDDLFENKESMSNGIENFFKTQVTVFDQAVQFEKSLHDDLDRIAENEEAHKALNIIRLITLVQPGSKFNYNRIRELNPLMDTVRTAHDKMLEEKRTEVLETVRQCMEATHTTANGDSKASHLIEKSDKYFSQCKEKIAELKSLALLDAMFLPMCQYKDDTVSHIETVLAPPAPKPQIQPTQTGKEPVPAKKKVVRVYNRQVVFQAKTLQTDADIDDYVEKIRSQLKQLLKNCDEIKLN